MIEIIIEIPKANQLTVDINHIATFGDNNVGSFGNFFNRKHKSPTSETEEGLDMETSEITCGDVLDISAVGQMHAEFIGVFEKKQAIEISAGSLQKIDGAGVQMLVALFAQAERNQTEIKWKDTSAPLLDAAALLGVSKQLQLV